MPDKSDEVIKKLETNATAPGNVLPDETRDAIKVLKDKRAKDGVKCYEFEGGMHGRVDPAKNNEIQYDGMDLNQVNESNVLHEAVHALHNVKYPKAAKGIKSYTGTVPIEALKFKAWTEYKAYQNVVKYALRDKEKSCVKDQTCDSIHEQYRTIPFNNTKVRPWIMKVREQQGPKEVPFDPENWTPAG